MAYEDLLKDTSQYVESGDYFLLTITDLDINTSYPIQFRWKKKDGTYSTWSAVRSITTPGESTPATPSALTVEDNTAGYLNITWDGKDALGNTMSNIDRLDIYIDGSPFDATKPAASFFSAGTQTIVAPAGTYIVAGYAVSKAGTKSAINSPVTRTVKTVGEVIAPPTLPSGISVVTAPFAVSVTWPGTYASSSFTGFKSIDIYAVSSDLGSTATSGISSTNLVGSLTVQDTPNKVNIGLDNLKQALGLSTTADVYTSTIFYYFNASNKNGDKYGSPTYTRINSSSVVPTKANFVDIASGVISIENLVAGNGSFSSWLRTGASGGARIELSGVSDFTNGGNTVQKGLVAYTSGNTELFNLDLDASTLTINGSGTFTGNLSIGSSNSIFKAEPATGIWLGNSSYSSAPFSVSTNGVIKADAGKIGGWTLSDSYLQGTNFQINSSNSTMYIGPYSSGDHIRISASGGIQHTNSGGSATGKFTLTPNGNLTLSGTFTIDGSSTIDGTAASTVKSGAASGSAAVQPGNGVSVDGSKQITTISTSSGLTISTASSGSRVELTSSGLKAYSGSTNTVAINSDGSASFTGVLTAQAGGSIGGFTVASDYLYSSSGAFLRANGNFVGASISGSDLAATNQVTAGTYLSAGTTLTVGGSATFGSVSGLFEFLSTSGNIRVASTYNQGISGGKVMYVSSAGLYGVLASTERLKENITPYSINEDALLQLEPVTFNFIDSIDSEGNTEYGFIAEDADRLGLFELTGYDEEGLPNYFAYEKLPIFLLQLIKTQKKEIDLLKSRLDALEG